MFLFAFKLPLPYFPLLGFPCSAEVILDLFFLTIIGLFKIIIDQIHIFSKSDFAKKNELCSLTMVRLNVFTIYIMGWMPIAFHPQGYQ
jgi:hypothetical protein